MPKVENAGQGLSLARRRLYCNCGCEFCVLSLDFFKDFRNELAVHGKLAQAFDEVLDFTFFSSCLVFLHCLDMHRHVMADDVEDDFSKFPGDRHLGLFGCDALAQPSGVLPQVGLGACGGHGRHFEGVGQGVAGALALSALANLGAHPGDGGESKP